MIIFAVDPGTRNMGYACYDTDKRGFITFGKFDMQKDVKKKNKTKYALLTRRFCDAMHDYINMSDAIIIEAQMQAKMKMIQTALQCFHWDKSHVIGPLAVRKFFKISMNDYNKNKRASEKLANIMVKRGPEKELLEKFDKKDDVADAIILARYWEYKQNGEDYTGPDISAEMGVKNKKRKRINAPCARSLTGKGKGKRKK